jgi:hypothetical protein
MIDWDADTCPASGTETWYAPNAATLECPSCHRQVPVESNDKDTWFRTHKREAQR